MGSLAIQLVEGLVVAGAGWYYCCWYTLGGVLSLDDVEGPRCRCPGWRSSGAGWGRSRGRGGDTEEERVCGGEVRGVRGHGGGLAEVAGRVLERGALPVHLQLLPQDIFSNS